MAADVESVMDPVCRYPSSVLLRGTRTAQVIWTCSERQFGRKAIFGWVYRNVRDYVRRTIESLVMRPPYSVGRLPHSGVVTIVQGLRSAVSAESQTRASDSLQATRKRQRFSCNRKDTEYAHAQSVLAVLPARPKERGTRLPPLFSRLRLRL